MSNTKYIESYNLPDFLAAAQASILEGYLFDFETNLHFPQQWGTRFLATMIKVGDASTEVQGVQEVKQEKDVENVEEVLSESNWKGPEGESVQDQVQEPAKRGRKAKG